MASNVATKSVSKPEAGNFQHILISQPRPQSEKSPYYDLEKKHGVILDFETLIMLEPISGKDFRKQKINISNYIGVIFTSRNAIDHFFRTCEEMKVSVSQDTKYFCITEAVALYLQKFILYRKRKVFYGTDGSNKSFLDVINKHKENINFLYVCSENQQDNEIISWLKQHNCEFDLGFMYRTQSNDVKESLSGKKFDVLCFFTPTGIKSWFDNFPNFKQDKVLIGTFGDNTRNAAIKAGLKPVIVAPSPKTPSMITALDQYFTKSSKK